ncbi:MAG: hypothetical protein ABSE56_12250 [Bryobacteraceae bacterium]|jgi:hypothetical protein
MKNAQRNWKTTVMGILTLALLAFNVYKNPSALSDPAQQVQLGAGAAAGIGLIVAKDADQTGTADQPKQ